MKRKSRKLLIRIRVFLTDSVRSSVPAICAIRNGKVKATSKKRENFLSTVANKNFKGGLNFITGNCKPIERRKSSRVITPEKDIQASFIAWRDLHKEKYPVLKSIFSVPNGIWTFRAVAVAMIKQGLTPGIQDIICLAPSRDGRYHGLLIEFKTEDLKRSVQSKEQIFFHEFFAALGYRTEVCRSWQAASRIVCEHLDLNLRY